MFILAIAQESQTAAAVPQENPLMSFLPIILIFVIFYFILIRPQRKSQLEHEKMLQGVKKNDEIITSGGIYGVVLNVQSDTLTVRVDDDVKIKITRNAVAQLVKKSAE
ncbi:MAG TPA: preprotein translocase subunit YajC [Candidatus Omnitrophota bacterium]|nr:preprotein translocase subunit YajC [Candidatus Omnitrophota bacterium]